jgi:hypothetical protein
VLDDEQNPVPVQLAADRATPPVHEAERHGVVELGKVHAVLNAPLHVPWQTVPSPAQAARNAGGPTSGSPVTALHVPSDPATSHASH